MELQTRSSEIVLSSLRIYLFLFWFCNLIPYSFAANNETDRLTLLEFKSRITDDPLRVLTSWNDSVHFCRWHGIVCGSKNQRVVALQLPSSRLQGSLPPSIGNLSFLRALDIQNNGFRDNIPQEIGRLSRLQYLGLENNTFGGHIPSNISRCVNLEFLRLGNNELVGKVPDELGSLNKLRELYIYFNYLSGEIPPSFGNLSYLEVVSAARNGFVGSIPSTLGNLKLMYYVAFGSNKLSGNIPSSLYNLSSLMYLHFPDNKLSGNLPSSLGFTLPNLQVINVAANNFTGPLPASISNATNLMRLTIPLNRFIGKVPSLENLHKLNWVSISQNELGNGVRDDLSFLTSLINATSLQLLAINNNRFGGVLPESIGNLSSQLSIFSVENNNLFGSIPSELGNLKSLEIMYLGNNQFTGQIPASIGYLQNLKDLQFHGNNFFGNIPSSLGNLNLLNKLTLDRNHLQGSIPSSLGRLRSLILLDLSQNNLTGGIPPDVVGISSLAIYLDLSRNKLNGSLPNQVENLKNLGVLDVSNNMLSGRIPSSLGSCVTLQQLIMKGNSFHGSIPTSLSSLRGIQNLDLSENNLSGPIPEYLATFRFLQNLNLSYNGFEGAVPVEGVFKNRSAVSLAGNDKLCGGVSELLLSTCSSDRPKRKKTSSMKMIILIASGVLALAVVLCLVLFYWFKKTRKGPASSEVTFFGSYLQVSYENLLKATNGFSSDNKIGTGGFGSVYKGIFEDDGKVVAVKVFNLENRGAAKSFDAECEALRNIRHRNLVKVVSACSSIDFQGNEFKALVYDFMVNGNLDEWLHDQVSRKLNLLQRLNIMIDVASALGYLHLHCEPPVVHCDLKPSNVLLDGDMTGHVSDFGLARFVSEEKNTISSDESSSIGLQGSMGYAAPEYGMGSKVSTHGDVYSFGILLLETFTRIRPTDEMFKDSLNLHSFVKERLRANLAEITDPLIYSEAKTQTTDNNNHNNNNADEDESILRRDKVDECLISIFEIGVACSVEIPKERMNIGVVEAQLRSVYNKVIKTRNRVNRPIHR